MFAYGAAARARATLPLISASPSLARVVEVLLAGRPTTSAAPCLRVARDGRWEDARRLDLPADVGGVRGLVRAAGGADDDVAAELQWPGRPFVFVGARRAGASAAAAADFEERVACAAGRGPADPAVALAALAGGPVAATSHFELGAINAWKSVGPLRLWQTGDPVPSPAATAERLREHPALARCAVAVALEVAFSRPCECWLGVEVSSPAGAARAVAPAILALLLEQLLA